MRHTLYSGLCVLFLALPCAAQHDPLPDGSVSLVSAEGRARLLRSQHKESYWPLSVRYETELGQSHCGPASAVMVLNALSTSSPTTLTHAPFKAFEQDNFFSKAVDAILPDAMVRRQGCTLEQLAAMVGSWGTQVEVHHVNDEKSDEFREAIKQSGQTGTSYVIVNFFRKPLSQAGGGHFSPIAAYDEETDSCLVMDVARYKYPPFWVPTEMMVRAMNTGDSSSGKHRGYFVVRHASTDNKD